MDKVGVQRRFYFGWKPLVSMVGASLAVQFICLLIPLAVGRDLQEMLRDIRYLMFATALSWLAVIWVFDYFFCRPQTGRPLRFNMRGVNVGTFFLSLPLFFGMILISDFLVNQIPTTGPYFGKAYRQFNEVFSSFDEDFPAAFLGAVIMGPLLEEVVFRGIILKGLLNKNMSPTKAIWISSILFGLVHGNPWQFVGATLIGFALGLIFLQTKSLLLVIVLHIANNLISVLLAKYSGTETLSEFFHLPAYGLLMVGLVLYGSAYYFFTEKFRIIHREI